MNKETNMMSASLEFDKLAQESECFRVYEKMGNELIKEWNKEVLLFNELPLKRTCSSGVDKSHKLCQECSHFIKSVIRFYVLTKKMRDSLDATFMVKFEKVIKMLEKDLNDSGIYCEDTDKKEQTIGGLNG